MPLETHPLQPFLPKDARLLMLGSFPPPTKRWAMDFYYPNFNNDMWRIFGIVFFGSKNYFIDENKKSFLKEKIINFLIDSKIALFDTATAVERLNDDASDKFLKIVQPTDIKSLLSRMPQCAAIAVTGQKAADVFTEQFKIDEIKTGDFTDFIYDKRLLRFYRMPSSSRAYPLKLEAKAEIYGKMFEEIKIW
jgi:hypoxanthine-DNA glycosylase